MSGVNSRGADFMLPRSCKQWKGKEEELTQSLDYSLWMNIQQWHSTTLAATEPPNSESLCEPQPTASEAKLILLLMLQLFTLTLWAVGIWQHQNDTLAPRDCTHSGLIHVCEQAWSCFWAGRYSTCPITACAPAVQSSAKFPSWPWEIIWISPKFRRINASVSQSRYYILWIF